MRYRGASANRWPLLLAVIAIIAIAAVVYVMYFQH